MATRIDTHVADSADDQDRYTVAWVVADGRAPCDRVAVEQAARGGGDGLLVDVGSGAARSLVSLAHDLRLDAFRILGVDHVEDMVERGRVTVAAAVIDGATLEAPAVGPGAIGFEITIRRPLG